MIARADMRNCLQGSRGSPDPSLAPSILFRPGRCTGVGCRARPSLPLSSQMEQVEPLLTIHE
uniref:Uncharacterized protein n=1 Tax=Coccidioides posadasii RMSCC 3488 TaxID=454284 RepID=A0A0J6FW97_COCPO|nr:hypothetical protein CPAG_09778 [Coccidioides posadasii RMSCC 3488]